MIPHPANEATPATAFNVVEVQPIVPDPEATTSVTEAVDVNTVLPDASSTVTWGWAPNDFALWPDAGVAVNTNFDAEPKTVKLLLVAGDSDVAVAVSVKAPGVPAMEQPLNVAVPIEAVTGLVEQESEPVPEATDSVTAAEEAAMLPAES